MVPLIKRKPRFDNWANYGGCIPSILEALDTIKDLDGALNPWEDTLSNRDRNMILKLQSDWERASEIFEWFKGNGCYELYVIHYNIMLRILGELENGAMLNVCVLKWELNGFSKVTMRIAVQMYKKAGEFRKEFLKLPCWWEDP